MATSTSPDKENRTPLASRRSSARREKSKSLWEDDSVDYVVIKKPQLEKKKKLTDHQKEVFSAPREPTLWLDESSQLSKEPLSRIGSHYDVDTSSQSASANLTPGLAVKSQDPQTFEGLIDETSSTEKSSSGPRKRGRPAKQKNNTDNENALPTKQRCIRLTYDESSIKSTPSVESVVDIVSTDNSLTIADQTKTEQTSVSTDGEPEILETAKTPKSRRSLGKSTPTRYTPKNATPRERLAKMISLKKGNAEKIPIKKLVQKKITRKMSKELEKKSNETSSDEFDDSRIQDILDHHKNLPLLDQAKRAAVTPCNSTTSSIETLFLDSEPPSEISLRTPTKNSSPSADEAPAAAVTPNTGILKKVATPATQEGKRRVHFGENVGIRERDGSSTPNKCVARIDSYFAAPPSTEPIFPALITETTAIEKITDKLAPVSTATGPIILIKAMKSKKITTIGQLAALSEAALRNMKLPTRIATIKSVLQEIEDSLRPTEPCKTTESLDSFQSSNFDAISADSVNLPVTEGLESSTALTSVPPYDEGQSIPIEGIVEDAAEKADTADENMNVDNEVKITMPANIEYAAGKDEESSPQILMEQSEAQIDVDQAKSKDIIIEKDEKNKSPSKYPSILQPTLNSIVHGIISFMDVAITMMNDTGVELTEEDAKLLAWKNVEMIRSKK